MADQKPLTYLTAASVESASLGFPRNMTSGQRVDAARTALGLTPGDGMNHAPEQLRQAIRDIQARDGHAAQVTMATLLRVLGQLGVAANALAYNAH